MTTLKKITTENFEECIHLKVADNQQTFVASNIYSLAEAWVNYEAAFPFAIYSDDIMVGFLMIGYDKTDNTYAIWRFMIDEKYQHKGYGKSALHLAINYIKETFNPKEIYLSFEPENHNAEKLYQSVGFIKTGEIIEDEVLMKLAL